MFITESCILVLLYIHGKSTFAIVRFVKVRNKALNKSREMSVRKIILIERQIEYWSCSVHLFCCYATDIVC